jgi:hypothetical protein
MVVKLLNFVNIHKRLLFGFFEGPPTQWALSFATGSKTDSQYIIV